MSFGSTFLMMIAIRHLHGRRMRVGICISTVVHFQEAGQRTGVGRK